ncbi:hypothetical protein [Luteolibacter luteus]|uniref:DUF559 domain-containing protein n=1 Tax=Luteolibacter luteus TaxID=2728835 RepID=A0A858RIW1_9BACT|nr:hypothetical protein [Luteolibacter luteus]QJE95993.1 hypothetical protein HHL09_09425 [Luteolibacter luteus]
MEREDSYEALQAQNRMVADYLLAHASEKVPLEKCDSPIEDEFYWEFRKVVNPEVNVSRQVEIRTGLGLFRPDFVMEWPAGGRKIAVECDGKEFHEAERDARRDSAIVATRAIERVYRLKGADICWHPFEVIDLLGLCEPWLLSERGRLNLSARTLPISQRRESLRDWSMFFSGEAWRAYDSPNDSGDQVSEGLYPQRPIAIAWTHRFPPIT